MTSEQGSWTRAVTLPLILPGGDPFKDELTGGVRALHLAQQSLWHWWWPEEMRLFSVRPLSTLPFLHCAAHRWRKEVMSEEVELNRAGVASKMLVGRFPHPILYLWYQFAGVTKVRCLLTQWAGAGKEELSRKTPHSWCWTQAHTWALLSSAFSNRTKFSQTFQALDLEIWRDYSSVNIRSGASCWLGWPKRTVLPFLFSREWKTPSRLFKCSFRDSPLLARLPSGPFIMEFTSRQLSGIR